MFPKEFVHFARIVMLKSRVPGLSFELLTVSRWPGCAGGVFGLRYWNSCHDPFLRTSLPMVPLMPCPLESTSVDPEVSFMFQSASVVSVAADAGGVKNRA